MFRQREICKLLTSILLTIPLFFLLSCGEEEGATSFQSNSNVPLKITINTSEDVSQNQDLSTAQGVEVCLAFVDTVSVVVQGNFPTISQQFSIGEDIIVIIPPGPDPVTIIVSLLNNGQACCSGQATLVINPNTTNEVTIDCEKVDEICNDDFDNNGNEETDCEEEDCAGSLCDGTNINRCIDGECIDPTPPPVSEVGLCTDGIDNDDDEGEENGGIDCMDLDCAFDPACVEICNNGVDEPDADGEDNADCLDESCDGEPCNAEDEAFICVENDCIDPTDIETDCDNGISDDTDALIDCDDPDCEGMICFEGNAGSACVQGECQEVVCDDNDNNDGDLIFGEVQATDCDDIDCDGADCEIGPGVGAQCDFNGDNNPCRETNCFDFDNSGEGPEPIDNDLDESANCDDFDCDEMPCGTGQAGAGARCTDFGFDQSVECRETACTNDVDDDRDEGSFNGGTDCFDPDCTGQPCGDLDGAECFDPQQQFQIANAAPQEDGCMETNCGNLEDDDLDGAFDCADADCMFVSPCEFPDGPIEQTCDDNFDNDGDGFIDCQDTDCQFDSQLCDTPPEGEDFQFEGFECDDNVDNDNDGLTDCADPSCDGNGDNIGECGNVISPGFCEIDSGECEEGVFNCGDAVDNDEDGETDCADPDCDGQVCGDSMMCIFGTCQ